MCLYESKLLNPRYLPNEKNNGQAPLYFDIKKKYIKTFCGWCIECRKQLSNQWRIRLSEELKDDNNCIMVTLTFSSESLNKLETDMYLKEWRGLKTENGDLITDCNLLAAYAVRMWCERWRKHYKKSPKHWLITELGHNGTERIHLHGIVWGTAEQLEKTWKYGYVNIGKWVDLRTINYIVKYVTKVDADHKGYKQSIFTSKGIGKGYIKRAQRNRFNNEDTITTYKFANGSESELPRYYKYKIYSEEERDKIWSFKIDNPKMWLAGEEISKDVDFELFERKLKSARCTNKLSGYGNNSFRNKMFVITDAMKGTNFQSRENKVVERRYVEYEKIDESKEISKSSGTTIYKFGEYRNNTTEAQRNYNQLIGEARELNINVRTLRLIKKGIIDYHNNY